MKRSPVLVALGLVVTLGTLAGCGPSGGGDQSVIHTTWDVTVTVKNTAQQPVNGQDVYIEAAQFYHGTMETKGVVATKVRSDQLGICGYGGDYDLIEGESIRVGVSLTNHHPVTAHQAGDFLDEITFLEAHGQADAQNETSFNLVATLVTSP